MSSAARASFILGIDALKTSLSDPLVTRADTVGAFLRRGLAVVSYGLLETFIADRLSELTIQMNGGFTHVADLPERLQRAAFQEALRVAADRMQWQGPDLADVIAFTSSLGASLAASSGPIKISPLAWQWRGSNMGPDDLQRALRLFHVKLPWEAIGSLARRAGFGLVDPKAAATLLLKERNNSAHDSSYQVSNLMARTLPAHLLALGFSADVLMSVGAQQIKEARQEFLRDADWLRPDRIQFRFVKARSKDWAEILEGSIRAVRVNKNREAAFQRACLGANRKVEVVVLQDAASQVLDWAYPKLA